jgi:hypothetical protein
MSTMSTSKHLRLPALVTRQAPGMMTAKHGRCRGTSRNREVPAQTVGACGLLSDAGLSITLRCHKAWNSSPMCFTRISVTLRCGVCGSRRATQARNADTPPNAHSCWRCGLQKVPCAVASRKQHAGLTTSLPRGACGRWCRSCPGCALAQQRAQETGSRLRKRLTPRLEDVTIQEEARQRKAVGNILDRWHIVDVRAA